MLRIVVLCAVCKKLMACSNEDLFGTEYHQGCRKAGGTFCKFILSERCTAANTDATNYTVCASCQPERNRFDDPVP